MQRFNLLTIFCCVGPRAGHPAMWKYPFTTFMLDQVCGGASATLGERIVFMLKGLLL